MNRQKNLIVVALSLLFGTFSTFLGSPRPIAAQSPQQTTTVVMTHPSQGDVVEIAGSNASLTSTPEGASMTVKTSHLSPGHAVTAWWVAINRPENCATAPCTSKDVLNNTDVVKAEVTYAGGQIIGENGEASFSWQLPAGEAPNPWFGHGFTNPLGAEVHIVLNDHGPVIPEIRENMLSTYRGGCTDESLPAAFPATAKADGQPGPNTCRLFQVVIFQQQSATTQPATLPTTGGSSVNSLNMWLLLLTGSSLIIAGGWLLIRPKINRLF